jgi:hypothetical protein
MDGVDQPPHQPGEVVAVQMGHENRRNAVRINALAREPDERGRPAVDQELAAAVGDVEARLQSAAGAEGIARTDDG